MAELSGHPEIAALHFLEMDFPPDAYRVDTQRYYSAAFKQREDEAIWRRTWQAACREDELPEVGDWIEYGILNQSYVIVRGEDCVVRAFHNACRHRGNQLCVGKGNGGTLVCPFHLWQYKLDGTLKQASDRETFIPFDDGDYGLLPISCGSWGGFVFVNPDPAATSLLDFLGPLPELLAPYDIAMMVPTGLNVVQPLKCNWKVGIDAFSESYHVQGIHPQNLPMVNDYDRRHLFLGRHRVFIAPFGSASPRLGVVDPEETVEAFGIMEKVYKGPDAENPMEALVSPYRDASGTIAFPEGVSIRSLSQDNIRRNAAAQRQDFSRLSQSQLVDNYSFLIFPNLTINLRAGDMTMFKFMPDPDGDPEVCLFEAVTGQLVPDPKRARALRKPRRFIGSEESMGLVVDQDRELMPRQQVGLRSSALKHLMLSKQEIAVLHFHQQLDAHIAEYERTLR